MAEGTAGQTPRPNRTPAAPGRRAGRCPPLRRPAEGGRRRYASPCWASVPRRASARGSRTSSAWPGAGRHASPAVAMGWGGSVIAIFPAAAADRGHRARHAASSPAAGSFSCPAADARFVETHARRAAWARCILQNQSLETLKSIAKFVVIGGVGGPMIYLARAPDFVGARRLVHCPAAACCSALCLQVLGGICVAHSVFAGGGCGAAILAAPAETAHVRQ